MTLRDLIYEQEDKLKNRTRETDLYEILLFVLQLPSICSRIEFPQSRANTEGTTAPNAVPLYDKNKKPKDKALYFKWLDNHSLDLRPLFYSFMDAKKIKEAIYSLRNSITHAGILLDSSKIFLCSGETGILVSGDITFVSVIFLCEILLSAAKKTTYIKNPEISPYKGLILPCQKYDKIKSFYWEKAADYWNNREEDRSLYNQYSQNEELVPEDLPNKSQVKRIIREANEYFEKVDAEVREMLKSI